MSMLAFTTFIYQVLSKLEDQPVGVAVERCLNRHHKDAGCHRCIDLCPQQAISQLEYIQVDTEKCVNCGLCWCVCPTEVFTLKAVDERKLLAQVGSLLSQGNRLEFACSRAAGDEILRSNCAGVLELNCLGQLSPLLLVGSIVAGAETIWLNDSLCHECKLRANHAIVEETVGVTRSLIRAFGREQSVFNYKDSADLLSGEGVGRTAVRLRAEDSLLSRRDVFRSLGGRAALELTDMASNMIRDILSFPATGKSLEQHIPMRRRLLARLLAKLGKPATDLLDLSSLPMAEIVVNDRCSACGLCSRFCPTGALQSEASDDDIKFTFTTAYCIACGICQKVCPSDAIKLSYEIRTSRLIEQEPEVLVHRELSLCTICGAQCVSNGSEPLCFVCRKNKDRRKALSNSLFEVTGPDI